MPGLWTRSLLWLHVIWGDGIENVLLAASLNSGQHLIKFKVKFSNDLSSETG